ncbi:MAG: F0F1 ATP synthase subunit gamma [Candidatus Omnitrophica bacterium]|nr:F0F1 ATP synthase subunit gamma [Candidatus Omnitrophota bacterium]
MGKAAVTRLRDTLKDELKLLNTLNVLKQIAIAEYQYLDSERRQASAFLRVLRTFFRFYHEIRLEDSLFVRNPCQDPAVVVLTSDEGFTGNLNAQIIDRAARRHDENPATQVVVLGRRGALRLAELGVPAVEFEGIGLPLGYSAVSPLKPFLLDQYLNQKIGSATIIYARCQSFTRQTLEESRVLPFHEADITGADDGSLGEMPVAPRGLTIIEPDIRKIVDYTIALWFGRRLYELFWESKLSEVANRSIELSERHERLSRQRGRTLSRYFRASHEVIDAGIREVFASHAQGLRTREEEE